MLLRTAREDARRVSIFVASQSAVSVMSTFFLLKCLLSC